MLIRTRNDTQTCSLTLHTVSPNLFFELNQWFIKKFDGRRNGQNDHREFQRVMAISSRYHLLHVNFSPDLITNKLTFL